MTIMKYIGWCIKGIRRKIRRMSPTQKKLAIVAMIALLAGCFMGNGIGKASEKKRSEKKVQEAVAKVQKKAEEKLDSVEKELYALQDQLHDHSVELPWNLVLVNGLHPMEEGYVPELTEIQPGYSVDTRIANATRKMLSDAEKEGLHVEICSAYRSVERQEQVFGDSMKERVKSGMSYWKAYEETTLNVAIPGTSEHALGLALDLISNQYTELDEKQEETKEAQWLAENCYKYGFILRYPPEKTNITGIIYEPWHYRYVGEEHAAKIKQLGVTLEEYLQEHYQAEEGGQ
ncbi:MAG: M15 family metallopeptidase [Tyzzerella sp.]|nr:M15 family metallopeptidase [Tyzzerella sp.]